MAPMRRTSLEAVKFHRRNIASKVGASVGRAGEETEEARLEEARR